MNLSKVKKITFKEQKVKLKDVNERIEKGQEYRDGLLKQKHTGLDEELLKVKPETLTREIAEYQSKITLTELDLKQVVVVEPSEYYHEDQHDNVKDLLSEEKVKLGTMESKISDITDELKDFEGGFSCQYCGIELAKSDYADKKKEESKDLEKKVKKSVKELKS